MVSNCSRTLIQRTFGWVTDFHRKLKMKIPNHLIPFGNRNAFKKRKKKRERGENRGWERSSHSFFLFLLSHLLCFRERERERRILTQSCHVFMRSILIPFRDPESVTCIHFCSFRSRSNQMNNRKKRGKKRERESQNSWEDQNRSQAVVWVRFRSAERNDSRCKPLFSVSSLAIPWFINLNVISLMEEGK